MSTFLNIDLTNKTPKKFIWKHFLFSLLWILAVAVLLFRVDVFAINLIAPEFQWFVGVLPLLLVVLTIVVILSQKWYYSLVAIFYPLLIDLG